MADAIQKLRETLHEEREHVSSVRPWSKPSKQLQSVLCVLILCAILGVVFWNKKSQTTVRDHEHDDPLFQPF